MTASPAVASSPDDKNDATVYPTFSPTSSSVSNTVSPIVISPLDEGGDTEWPTFSPLTTLSVPMTDDTDNKWPTYSPTTATRCEGSNPELCGCGSVNQADYRGSISTTASGKECMGTAT